MNNRYSVTTLLSLASVFGACFSRTPIC